MRKTATFIFLIALLCCVVSCAKGDEDCLSYQEKAFDCELEVFLSELTFSAKVSGGEWSAESGMERNIRIEFTAPRTLCGMILTRENGETVVSFGDPVFEDSGEIYSSLAHFTRLFELTAVPTDFSIEDKNTRAVLSGENGETVSLLLGSDGLPIEISDGNITIKVRSFEVR